MVVLHVVCPAEVGGLEGVVRQLVVGQRERGHEVHLAAVAQGRLAPGLEGLADAGATLHRVAVSPRGYLRERAAVRALCREVAPDIVHTHGYRPDVVDAGIARRLGIPTVTTVHGFTGGGWRNRLYEVLQRRAFRAADAVCAVSAALARQLVSLGVSRDRLHVVPNAWRSDGAALDRAAARRALGILTDGFRIGWVGRVSAEKGADVLLAAMGHLVDLPLAVSVLGDGPERKTLERRARARGLDVRLTWHGVVPDAGRLFRAFDLFVLSSRTEGIPLVLFEAMAARVPIVATAVGGVPEMLGPAEAILVPPDDPEALASGIRCVIKDPASAASRAEAAAGRLARDFRTEPWLRRYEEVYRLVARTAMPATAEMAG